MRSRRVFVPLVAGLAASAWSPNGNKIVYVKGIATLGDRSG